MPEQGALDAALRRVGDRWTLLIVEALLDGPQRYNQLQEAVAGIATNVLSQRLKQLEQQGLVRAEPYSQRPPRYRYALTGAGRELGDPLRLLAAWGAAHGDDAQSVGHVLCGTPLQARWFCPTCDEVVAAADADPLRYV
ncbi:MAG TPA: helix-turn-helix domain-containing protein [Egibacteraceae bacterium]|nr:helix-turn-helix domain-containing protein [Egibacteraceae bacterium]